jgi:hypothetical protein
MFTPRWTVIDPAAQNRHHSTGRSAVGVPEARGLDDPGPEQPAGGLQRRQGTAEGCPRSSLCRRRVTSWPRSSTPTGGKQPKGRVEDAPKAEPIKRNDDLLDALRYLVMSMPQAAEKRGLSLPRMTGTGSWSGSTWSSWPATSAARVGGVL